MMDEPMNTSSKVAQFLIGLQLEKYVPLFQEKNINLNIFLSLTEEDLNFIGVEDKEDVEKILKYVETIRGDVGNEKIIKSGNEISANEVAIALAHSIKDFQAMKTALKIIGVEMLKNDNMQDVFVCEEKTACKAIEECIQLYAQETKMILLELDNFEAAIKEPEHSIKKDKRKTIFMCATVTAVIAISVFVLHRKL